jgi:hypothetical protein
MQEHVYPESKWYPTQLGELMSPKGGIMKKEITIAIMATILVLQFIGSTVGGFVGDIANGIADQLSSRVQIEKILSEEY